MESLVSDILAGDGKTANLFLTVWYHCKGIVKVINRFLF